MPSRTRGAYSENRVLYVYPMEGVVRVAYRIRAILPNGSDHGEVGYNMSWQYYGWDSLGVGATYSGVHCLLGAAKLTGLSDSFLTGFVTTGGPPGLCVFGPEYILIHIKTKAIALIQCVSQTRGH